MALIGYNPRRAKLLKNETANLSAADQKKMASIITRMLPMGTTESPMPRMMTPKPAGLIPNPISNPIAAPVAKKETAPLNFDTMSFGDAFEARKANPFKDFKNFQSKFSIIMKNTAFREYFNFDKPNQTALEEEMGCAFTYGHLKTALEGKAK